MLEAFAKTVSAGEVAVLYDPTYTLPFANLQVDRRRRRRHGIGGSDSRKSSRWTLLSAHDLG